MFKYTNIAKPFSVRPPHGGVNWIEIPAVDVQALRAFYQAVFPSWKFPKSPRHQDDFIALFKIEEPVYIEGAIVKVNDHTLTRTNNGTAESIGMVVSFMVDSIEAAHEKIISLGGKQVLGKTDARGDGWFAKYLDPAGSVFMIYEVTFESFHNHNHQTNEFKRAVDWVPWLRHFREGDHMTDCEHLLTLVMGSVITDEGRDAFRQNAERLLPHYYERAREDEILMIGMEQSQYWVLREMYLDLADDCYRGLYSRGLIFPDFDRKNLDYGYAYWLQKYDSEFFEHKNIARLHLLDGPVQREIDHGSRPCPCRNCDGNCTRDLLDADIRRSRPVAASQGAPTPPTGIEKISIAERCERISLWKDTGLSKTHREPKEYPFEVGIPAHIGKEEQLRLFKSEEHTESVAEYLDERLRIIWTEHNGSTFLTVIKKPATCSPLREIETYDVPWRCLLDYSTELLKGRKPTLLEHFKTWHVDSMDAADKCKQRLVLHGRLYAHRQSQQREEGWRKKLIDHVKKRTAQICKDTQNSSLERATGITKLWTTTGCYKKTPLSLEDVGYCIMSAWGSFDGDGRVIENAKQASAWLWKTRNLSREYLEQQPSLAELVTKLGLDEIIPDVSNDGRRDNA